LSVEGLRTAITARLPLSPFPRQSRSGTPPPYPEMEITAPVAISSGGFHQALFEYKGRRPLNGGAFVFDGVVQIQPESHCRAAGAIAAGFAPKYTTGMPTPKLRSRKSCLCRPDRQQSVHKQLPVIGRCSTETSPPQLERQSSYHKPPTPARPPCTSLRVLRLLRRAKLSGIPFRPQ